MWLSLYARFSELKISDEDGHDSYKRFAGKLLDIQCILYIVTIVVDGNNKITSSTYQKHMTLC